MRPEKISMMDEILGRVRGSSFLILANHGGMKVTAERELRSKLRSVKAEIHVVKNNMFRHVTKDYGVEQLQDGLKGPTSVITGSGDVTAVAKLLRDFAKDKNLQVIKMGALGGKFLSKADIDALANLPSREVILGKLLGTLQAPAQQLVGVLNSAVATLPRVLKAVEEKKAAASA